MQTLQSTGHILLQSLLMDIIMITHLTGMQMLEN